MIPQLARHVTRCLCASQLVERLEATTRHAEGRPIFLQGIAFDVTLIKEAEVALAQMNVELDLRVKEKTGGKGQLHIPVFRWDPDRSVTRRDFLTVGAATGAALYLAACGGGGAG